MTDRFYVIRWICALLQVIGMGMIGGNYGWYIGRMIQFRDHASRLRNQKVSVSADRSFQAAMRLKKEFHESRIAVLNFANAFHPGGGVEAGASAQEECLCRCSTLYPLLNRNYLLNKKRRNIHESARKKPKK